MSTLTSLLTHLKSFLCTKVSVADSCSTELMLSAVAEPDEQPLRLRRRRQPA